MDRDQGDDEARGREVGRAKGMLRDIFDSTRVTAAVGSENFFPTVRAGVEAFARRESSTGS